MTESFIVIAFGLPTLIFCLVYAARVFYVTRSIGN
jgi:hypothetical protein